MANKIATRPIMPVRLARLHARLLISIAFGVTVTLGLAMTDWRTATKLLLGWDIGVVLYLVVGLPVDGRLWRRRDSPPRRRGR